MTTRRQRRTAPALIGLGTGAVLAVAGVTVGPLRGAEPGPTTEYVAPAGHDSVAPAADAHGASDTPGSGESTPHLGTSLLPLFLPGYPPYLPALMKRLPKQSEVAAKPDPTEKAAKADAPQKAATPGLSGPAAQIVNLTNAERAKHGCGPLKVDSRLNTSAQRHSADMAKRNYFEHEDPDGEDDWDREKDAGFNGDSGGENIAMGQTSAAQAMNDWMHSPGHRRNILDCSFDSIGVGYVASGHYWTQNFGGGG